MVEATALTETQAKEMLSETVDDKLAALEDAMLEYPQIEIPATERFINGMYAREIVIPKDTLLTGAVHKAGYLDIMLSGDIIVATPQGAKRMIGPNVMEAPPGRKRAGYAFEDTRWVTVHRTDHFEPGDMIERLTCVTMAQYEQYVKDRDRADYQSMIADAGMDERQIRKLVCDESDMRPLPVEYNMRVYISDSVIDGRGVFANKQFNIGDLIGPVKIEQGRTVIGRYINHSAYPNSIAETLPDGSLALIATRMINPGDEIVTNYALTLQGAQGVLPCQ